MYLTWKVCLFNFSVPFEFVAHAPLTPGFDDNTVVALILNFIPVSSSNCDMINFADAAWVWIMEHWNRIVE